MKVNDSPYGSFRIKLEGPEHGWLNDWCYMILYWLVVSIPLKNMSSSVGMMTFPIYGENVPNDQPVIYLYLLDPNLFRLEGCMNPPGFFDLFAREDHLDSLSVSLGG